MTDEPKDESESDGSGIAELMGYDKWPRDVSLAFDKALGVASLKYIKNLDVDFATVIADAQAIETEFLPRVGDDNEENAQQVRRIIAAFLLVAAREMDQPFETCRRYWNDLQQLGFYRIERQVLLTGIFAICCREHGQTEIGLAVLDPLIVELERLRAEPSVTEFAAEYYEERLVSLRRNRAKLEAQKNGAEPMQG